MKKTNNKKITEIMKIIHEEFSKQFFDKPQLTKDDFTITVNIKNFKKKDVDEAWEIYLDSFVEVFNKLFKKDYPIVKLEIIKDENDSFDNHYSIKVITHE